MQYDLSNIDINGLVPDTEPDRQKYFMAKLKEYVSMREKELNRKLTMCVVTFGCQMNARDSEKLAGILLQAGFVETDKEDSDFVIYNTCTVRDNANQRVYGRLGYLKGLKKKNPNMIIALCGCMMQEPHVVEKIKTTYRFVDIIFGTHNIYKLAEILYTRLQSDRMIIDILKDTDNIVEDLPSERKFSFKQGVNIMFGCNNFCSYCIVPYVRGRERSRAVQDIINEIKALVADGVVEVMLLGQNVNSYGRGLSEEITFAQLLTEIEKIEGLKRIRFMMPHPKDLSDELIDVISKSKKICRHIHLPLQSGSSRILKLMNRHYTKEHYLELVKKIKERIPDVSVTTDIIVGFPGETEEDFLDTIDVCKQVEYDSAYTFIYSKRTGTPAAVMENQVSPEVVKDRFDRLLAVISEISAKNSGRDVGRVMDVMVEEVNDHSPNLMTGRLSNNILVHFEGCREMIGKVVKVSLEESKGFYYLGKIVD